MLSVCLSLLPSLVFHWLYIFLFFRLILSFSFSLPMLWYEMKWWHSLDAVLYLCLLSLLLSVVFQTPYVLVSRVLSVSVSPPVLLCFSVSVQALFFSLPSLPGATAEQRHGPDARPPLPLSLPLSPSLPTHRPEKVLLLPDTSHAQLQQVAWWLQCKCFVLCWSVLTWGYFCLMWNVLSYSKSPDDCNVSVLSCAKVC